jgi:hypothetical protein
VDISRFSGFSLSIIYGQLPWPLQQQAFPPSESSKQTQKHFAIPKPDKISSPAPVCQGK